jgi:hypothetical protein
MNLTGGVRRFTVVPMSSNSLPWIVLPIASF